VSLSSASLVGLAALTPQGMLGTVAGVAGSGIAAACAMLALGALRERTDTLDVREIRGLAIESPLLACAIAIALLGVGAFPGSLSFWTTWLVSLGAVVREPGVAAFALVAAVLLAASQSSALVRLVRGRLPEALRSSPQLVSFGGRVPDLRPRELAALAPLVIVIVLLGFYPAPLLGRAATTVRDLVELVSPPGPDRIE